MLEVFKIDNSSSGLRIDRWIKNNLTKIPQSLIEKDLRNGKIKVNKKKVGISIKPSTPVEVISKYLEHVDLVLIMTVEPGFGGQELLKDQIEKVKQTKMLIGDRKIDIEVDGGINTQNAKTLIDAGANILVSGSTIFKSKNYQKTINELRNL